MSHVPVLLHEVIDALALQDGNFAIDGTCGSGGHTKIIADRVGKHGTVLALDWDAAMCNRCRAECRDVEAKIIYVPANYRETFEVIERMHLPRAHGLLLDLGFSSEHIETSGRGFSFMSSKENAEPLRMTYDENAEPVHSILKRISEDELTRIVATFGEERYARKIARAILEEARRGALQTNVELADVICRAVPRGYERGRIHPATRTFQALRIFTNHELENLEAILKDIPRIMHRRGRVAIISFHSLEDRIVKTYFRNFEKAGILRRITKKPLRASEEEKRRNPKSRSAKLRVAELY